MDLEEEEAIVERLTLENREATKYDFDSMELSPDTESMEMKIDQELLNELDQYPLRAYLEENVNTKIGLFKTSSIDEIMRHHYSLEQPILKLPKSLTELALQLFKNLSSYMGDRKSSKAAIKHVFKYIRLTMSASAEIKDEAYCQVIRQIQGHHDQAKAIRGWNMLAIMCSCYAPSVELYKSLLNFFRETARGNVKEATKNYELLDLANTKSNFTENDIINRKEKIINRFIEYVRQNGLII